MKTFKLEVKLGIGRTRSDFLTVLPVLRDYILKQSAEFPQKETKHTLLMLCKQCLPLVSTTPDDLDRMVKVVGCIDTEKIPFRTFWKHFDATLTLQTMFTSRK